MVLCMTVAIVLPLLACQWHWTALWCNLLHDRICLLRFEQALQVFRKAVFYMQSHTGAYPPIDTYLLFRYCSYYLELPTGRRFILGNKTFHSKILSYAHCSSAGHVCQCVMQISSFASPSIVEVAPLHRSCKILPGQPVFCIMNTLLEVLKFILGIVGIWGTE